MFVMAGVRTVLVPPLDSDLSRAASFLAAFLILVTILEARPLPRLRQGIAVYVLVYSLARGVALISTGMFGFIWIYVGVSLAVWIGLAHDG
jgi:hypothetical protein